MIFGSSNISPTANNDSANVNQGGSVVINVLANDSDDKALNPASVTVTGAPTRGSTSVNTGNGAITYTQNGSAGTSDSFTYTVKDNQGATSNTATVTLTINPRPQTQPDNASVNRGASVAINVLANDSDDKALNPASVTVTGAPASGSTVVNTGNGVITYTHNGTAGASDSFTYTVKDNQGAGSIATKVTISITTASSRIFNDGFE
jgi:hypothetical protein